MSHRPLYFLTHEGNAEMFSGYGIPIMGGDKSNLAGMLMIDRPEKCPVEYLDKLHETFGDIQVGPMTINGDRGIYADMRISDPVSLSLVQTGIYNAVAGQIAQVLETSLRGGFLPKPKLKVRWSREEQLWMSEFDLGGLHERQT